jgi:DNA-directed RNA polymerase specialized sigma24 family protein
VFSEPPREQQLGAFFVVHAAKLERRVTGKARGLDRGAIEDACAFAWLALVQRPDIDLQRPGAYWWLEKVAVRRAWEHGRRQRRETPAGDFSADSPVLEPAGEEDELLDLVAERLQHADVHELLDGLHWRERRELLLYAHGLSYEEIADLS